MAISNKGLALDFYYVLNGVSLHFVLDEKVKVIFTSILAKVKCCCGD